MQEMLHNNYSLAGDGATIEAVRRPRGRPPGSKNRPKPPILLARDPEPPMSPYILQVPDGGDVVEAVARFCRRRNTGLCVLSGYGTVADVTIRQPISAAGTVIVVRGRFDILSMCATLLQHAASFPVPSGFTITLAGPQGLFGGLVAGALVAVGPVYVVAASFNNPSFQRLCSEDDAISDSGEEAHSPAISDPGGKNGETHVAVETGGLAMYSSHMSSDGKWAPAARQPPPPCQY